MDQNNPFQSQSAHHLQTLTNIHDILLKISQLLHIHALPQHLNFTQFNHETLNQIKLSLRKIYNKLLVNSSPIQKISSDNEKSELFQQVHKKQAYEQIQDLLQKQQNKNRCLLRKQFEFKQYQNSILDQLNEEKSMNRKLNNEINKLKDEIQQKTLQIMHLQNQARAYQRGNRDLLNNERSEILTSRTYNISTLGYLHGNNERSKQEKKMGSSRDKEYNKSNNKKVREMKQKALYALYNNQKKKNISQSINIVASKSHYEKMKKTSTTTIATGNNKTTSKKQQHQHLMKQLNSIEYSNNNKKIKMHERRKSEELIKKTSYQRDGRQSNKQHNNNKKRKDDIIIDRLQF